MNNTISSNDAVDILNNEDEELEYKARADNNFISAYKEVNPVLPYKLTPSVFRLLDDRFTQNYAIEKTDTLNKIDTAFDYNRNNQNWFERLMDYNADAFTQEKINKVQIKIHDTEAGSLERKVALNEYANLVDSLNIKTEADTQAEHALMTLGSIMESTEKQLPYIVGAAGFTALTGGLGAPTLVSSLGGAVITGVGAYQTSYDAEYDATKVRLYNEYPFLSNEEIEERAKKTAKYVSWSEALTDPLFGAGGMMARGLGNLAKKGVAKATGKAVEKSIYEQARDATLKKLNNKAFGDPSFRNKLMRFGLEINASGIQESGVEDWQNQMEDLGVEGKLNMDTALSSAGDTIKFIMTTLPKFEKTPEEQERARNLISVYTSTVALNAVTGGAYSGANAIMDYNNGVRFTKASRKEHDAFKSLGDKVPEQIKTAIEEEEVKHSNLPDNVYANSNELIPMLEKEKQENEKLSIQQLEQIDNMLEKAREAEKTTGVVELNKDEYVSMLHQSDNLYNQFESQEVFRPSIVQVKGDFTAEQLGMQKLAEGQSILVDPRGSFMYAYNFLKSTGKYENYEDLLANSYMFHHLMTVIESQTNMPWQELAVKYDISFLYDTLKSNNFGLEDIATTELPISQIHINTKDIPNFKAGANERGVVVGEELGGKYERLGTAPIVVMHRKNGLYDIITGRHRLDLAQRSGETTIPAQIVEEGDKYTIDWARMFDVEQNIRDEKGSIQDFTKYFSANNMTEEEAKAKGLLNRAKGRVGYNIGTYGTNALKSLFFAGKINQEKANAIASGAPNNEAVQAYGISKANDMPVDVLRNVLMQIVNNPDLMKQNEGEQTDMFGGDAFKSLADEMEKIARAVEADKKELREAIFAIKGASKKPEIAKKYGVDVKDPKALGEKIAEMLAKLQQLNNFATNHALMDYYRKKAQGKEVGEVPYDSTMTQPTEPVIDEQTGSLFQGEAENPAGYVRQTPESIVLALTAEANPTTFAHESFHLFDILMGMQYKNGLLDDHWKKNYEKMYSALGIDITQPGELDKVLQAGSGLEQSAYHGSSAKFDKFSLSFNGTGEGPNVHGYGVYVTLDKDIADKRYRQRLSAKNNPLRKYFDGKKITKRAENIINIFDRKIKDKTKNLLGMFSYVSKKDFTELQNETIKNIEITLQSLEFDEKNLKKDYYLEKQELNKLLDIFKDKKEIKKFFENIDYLYDEGQLYKVEIPENNVLLKEYGHLGKNSDEVKNNLISLIKDFDGSLGYFHKLFGYGDSFTKENLIKQIQSGSNSEATGRNFYDALTKYFAEKRRSVSVERVDQKSASDLLLKYGIKGIKYFGDIDGDCFVIFNDNDVDIKQTFYEFLGPNAQTADINKLWQAIDRTNAGEDADKVRQETGWFKGRDGKWRFEISDIDATLITRNKNVRTLGEVLRHDKLYEAYPELKDFPFKWNDRLVSLDAALAFEKGTGKPLYIESVNSKATDDKEIISNLLHEIMHWIQRKEGFSSGGVKSKNFTDSQKLKNLRQEISNIAYKIKEKTGVKYNQIKDFITNKDKIISLGGKELMDEYEKLYYGEKYEELYSLESSFGKYSKQSHEEEARLVEGRMDMTADEQKASNPMTYTNYKYPHKPEDLTVEFDPNVGYDQILPARPEVEPTDNGFNIVVEEPTEEQRPQATESLPDLDKYTKAREELAYEWQQYLSEGIAPQASFKSMFEHFKEMFIGLYENLKGTLKPQIREVFDDVYNTYKQAEATLDQLNLGALKKPDNWSDEDYKKYLDTIRKAKGQAGTSMMLALRKLAHEIQNNKKDFEEKQRLEKAARETLSQKAPYDLQIAMSKNDLKIDRASFDLHNGGRNRAKLGVKGVLTNKENGLSVEDYANVMTEQLGKQITANDVVNALISKSLDEAVDDEVAIGMAGRLSTLHPELYKKSQAFSSIQNENTIDLALLEYMMLNKIPASKLSIMRESLKLATDQTIGSMKITEAMNVQKYQKLLTNNYIQQRYKGTKKDGLAILKWKEACTLQLSLLAKQIAKEFTSFENTFSRFAETQKKEKTKDIDALSYDLIKGILHDVEFFSAESRAVTEIETKLTDWINNQKFFVGDMTNLDMIAKLFNYIGNNKKKYTDFTYDEFVEFSTLLRMVKALSEASTQLTIGEEKFVIENDAKTVADNIIHNTYYKGKAKKDVSKIFRYAFFGMMKPRFLKSIMPDTIYMRYVAPLSTGLANASLWKSKVAEDFEAIFQQYKDKLKDKINVKVENLNFVLDFETVLMAMLHSGNEHNSNCMIKTIEKNSMLFPIDVRDTEKSVEDVRREMAPLIYQAILESAPDEVFDMTNRIWEIIESHRQEYADAFLRVDKLILKPVKPNHYEFDGADRLKQGLGYFPASINTAEMTNQIDFNQKYFESGYPTATYLKDRVASHGDLDLTLGVLNRWINITGDYINIAEAWKNANMLFSKPMLKQALGEYLTKEIADWLKEIRTPTKTSEWLRALDNYSNIKILGLNMLSMARQFSSVFFSASDVPYGYLLKGMKKAFNQTHFMHTFEKAGELSPVMKARYADPSKFLYGGYDRLLFGESKIQKGYENISKIALWGMTYVDSLASIATWNANYEYAMIEKGLSEKEAQAYADRSVQMTQGDTSSFSKPSALIGDRRFYTKYASYFFSLASSFYADLMYKGNEAKMHLLWTMFNTLFVSVMFEQMMEMAYKTIIGEEDDDDDDILTKSAKNITKTMASTAVPYYSLGANTLYGFFFEDEKIYNSQITQLTPITNCSRIIKKWADGDLDNGEVLIELGKEAGLPSSLEKLLERYE